MQFAEQAQFVENLRQRLSKTQLKIDLLKQRFYLCDTVKQRIAGTIETAKSPASLVRLITYLLEHQGARTDHISRDCAIGNVSDAHTPPSRLYILEQLGLEIHCKTLPACNRFGAPTTIGHLFITTTDNRYEDGQK